MQGWVCETQQGSDSAEDGGRVGCGSTAAGRRGGMGGETGETEAANIFEEEEKKNEK